MNIISTNAGTSDEATEVEMSELCEWQAAGVENGDRIGHRVHDHELCIAEGAASGTGERLEFNCCSYGSVRVGAHLDVLGAAVSADVTFGASVASYPCPVTIDAVSEADTSA